MEIDPELQVLITGLDSGCTQPHSTRPKPSRVKLSLWQNFDSWTAVEKGFLWHVTLLREDRNISLWFMGNFSAQASVPSVLGSSRYGADLWQGPQLPPVCVVISIVRLSPGPHDAGHLLQQQIVVPVNDREPLLFQLRADTQGAFRVTSCVHAIMHTFIQRIPSPHTSFDLSTLWVLHRLLKYHRCCCGELQQQG